MYYIPHIISALAITSLSIHLLNHRKQNDAQNTTINARLSILTAIAHNLRHSPENTREIARLQRLALSLAHSQQPASQTHLHQPSNSELSWRDIFLGQPTPRTSDWDNRDLQQLLDEINAEMAAPPARN
ncbi:hypothetical protein HGRIS_001945 [Hohenbuehelia grisea]|uniref:Uncharacterized protein n=1 Tax=Hohenbuehelia grisea TaxID=104357 RepID=A0ABR3JIX8_9AGAR